MSEKDRLKILGVFSLIMLFVGGFGIYLASSSNEKDVIAPTTTTSSSVQPRTSEAVRKAMQAHHDNYAAGKYDLAYEAFSNDVKSKVTRESYIRELSKCPPNFLHGAKFNIRVIEFDVNSDVAIFEVRVDVLAYTRGAIYQDGAWRYAVPDDKVNDWVNGDYGC